MTALGESCSHFSDFISKVVLDSNKFLDQDFAKLLESISKLKSFRSIIYKKNGLGHQSVDFLERLLARKPPNHLEELRIEDCQIGPSVIESIVDVLSEDSYVKQLGLVKANMSAETFRSLARCVRKSAQNLTELDISSNLQRSAYYLKMLRSLTKNERLRYLNLSHNPLVPKNKRISAEADPEDREMEEEEIKVLKYLNRILTNNDELQHLDLTNTGLGEEVIVKLCERAKRSKRLQSLHFCGNPGLTSRTLRKVLQIFNLPGSIPTEENLNDETNQGGNRGKKKNSLVTFLPKPKAASLPPALREKLASEGRELKAIKEKLSLARRGRELTAADSVTDQRLIIWRILGFQKACPGVEKWRVSLDSDAQCWICECWRFSVLLLSKQIVDYGKEEMAGGLVTPEINIKPLEASVALSDIQAGGGIPRFYSDSTDWQPVKMQTIQDFCQKIDYAKPDFLQMLKDNDECRPQVNEVKQFSPLERERFDELREEYEQSYPFIYLNVFEKNLGFKKPLIINIEQTNDVFRR